MKRILYIITVILLVFSLNTTFQPTPVMAEDDVATEETVQQTKEEQTLDAATDDVLDKPIFNNQKAPSKTSKITGKISKIVTKILAGICILLVVSVCLFFIVIANKQRQNEIRRKRMSANANVINAVDNFARHRIKK